MRALAVAGILVLAGVTLANDHNNLEAGRPLRFDDAYSIALGERALEFGLSLDTFHGRASDYGVKSEFKYGFAKNQDIGVAFEPVWRGSDRQFDAGDVELSYFHGLAREMGTAPALGYRVDVGLPTGRDSRGVDVRLRGVLTKALGQYDKLHLNVDLAVSTRPGAGERRSRIGAVLGYSTPLGYPKRFDQTFVAEFALQESPRNDEGYTGSVGFGLRRQIDPRSVFDVGLSSDLFTTKGGERSLVRLTAGFSIGF